MTQKKTLEYLCEYVRARAAIVLDVEKSYLLENRLMPLVRKYKFDSLEALVGVLQKNRDPGLERDVIEAMTTNETFFFRDKVPFDTLKDLVMPKLIKARSESRRLRLWCAAASTGQEPYSVAMVIKEHFPELGNWKLDFVATDINETVLQQARDGRFKRHEVERGLSPELRKRYFREGGGYWQVSDKLREMIEFKKLNLVDRWHWEASFDIVFIRNVLIYFDVQTKQRILQRIRRYMQPDGVMFLGGAESTVNIDDSFECRRSGRNVYYALAA